MAGTDGGITERLVDYALGLKYEEIPPEVIERAKQLILVFQGLWSEGQGLVPPGAVAARVRELDQAEDVAGFVRGLRA